jgi:hypothetical protein
MESNTGAIGYSDVATVNVNAPFSSVTISPAVQHIFAGTTPAAMSGPAATGGSCGGSYGYQWQSSTDGGVTYEAIPGAQALAYSPGILDNTTLYRRKDQCGIELSYSNVCVVNVYQHLNAGAISPSSLTITYNSAPGYITSTEPTGGMCSNNYNYQWQKSSDNVTFTDIAGAATYLGYNPGNLTASVYFRRRVICGSETAYTNTFAIIVNPQVFPGTIAPDYLAIPPNTSPGPLIANAASGGACNSSFGYQWQQSVGNGSFTNIDGATGLNYTPGNITATTRFRRKVTCGIDVLYTNTCHVEVSSPITQYNYIQARIITKPGIVSEASAAQLTNTADVSKLRNTLMA